MSADGFARLTMPSGIGRPIGALNLILRDGEEQMTNIDVIVSGAGLCVSTLPTQLTEAGRKVLISEDLIRKSEKMD